MLKIVYPNCCGIDVHKTFVVAVIAITDDQGFTQYCDCPPFASGNLSCPFQ
ncbi:hypothetical protein [Siminovitchia sp. FSL W7-1587]|uniref:hypothetical protein n=1 Tax=Siminovitchia sp. FSL W7-1587 TaxID=2954699 RepID=UPI0030CE5A24